VRLTILLTLILSGCGSSWSIRVGEELEVGCALYKFYPDADEDGWGDGSVEPVEACEADDAAGLTARNGRDCDDEDNTITGRVGSICPHELSTGDGDSDAYAGVIYDSEYVIVYGDGDYAEHQQADILCNNWAGNLDGEVQGQLATFASAAELQEVRERIEDLVGTSPFAGFVGLAWDGPSNDDGSWQWVDENADAALIEQDLNWCNGVEPAPLDAYPHLVPGNPDHAAAINEQLSKVRLALVLDEAGDWCLGFPWDAVSETGPLAEFYTGVEGHFICQRVKQDAADYADQVVSDE